MSQVERALVLLFRAGGERAAIRAADVQKVTPVGHVSRLPRLPDVVTGITQHRGRVVTVVDAAALLFGGAVPRFASSSTAADASYLRLDATDPAPTAPASGPPAGTASSSSRFGLVAEAAGARLLILERPVRHLALRVDAVDEIESVKLSSDLPQAGLACLKVTQHKGRALQILDVEQLMAVIEQHMQAKSRLLG